MRITIDIQTNGQSLSAVVEGRGHAELHGIRDMAFERITEMTNNAIRLVVNEVQAELKRKKGNG